MRRYELGDPATALRRQLVAAVLRGDKTASTALLGEYERTGAAVPEVGERFELVDADDAPVAILEITDVRVLRLADAGLDLASAEGEGFADVAAWRAAHERYWSRYWPEDVTDDTLIVAESFRVVERLTSS